LCLYFGAYGVPKQAKLAEAAGPHGPIRPHRNRASILATENLAKQARRFLCPVASSSPNARHAQRPANDDESLIKRWILLNLKVAENGRGHACFILKVGQQKLRAAYLAANPTLNTRRVAPLPGAP